MSVPCRTVHSNLSATGFHECMMYFAFFRTHVSRICVWGLWAILVQPAGVNSIVCLSCACACCIGMWPLNCCIFHTSLSFCLPHCSLVPFLFLFFFCALHRMQTSCIRVSCRSSPLCPPSTLYLCTNGEGTRIKATPIAGLTLPLVKKWCTPAGGVAPTTALSVLFSDLGKTPGCPGWGTPTPHPGLKLPSENESLSWPWDLHTLAQTDPENKIVNGVYLKYTLCLPRQHTATRLGVGWLVVWSQA